MELDPNDTLILRQRQVQRDFINGPIVGDFVRMLDGSTRRFTHEYDDALQTTVGGTHPCARDQSFFLHRNGYAEFSGSLDPSIAKSTLRRCSDRMPGRFWFFHHDEVRAHNGVHVMVDCAVWEQLGATPAP